MELCTSPSISSSPRHRLFSASTVHPGQFLRQSSIPKIPPSNFNLYGSSRYFTHLTLKSSMSDEYDKDKSDSVITMEDTRPIGKEYVENVQTKVPEEYSSEENQVFGFLENLDIKFDSDDTYSTLLLGGGGLVALYLAIAVVSAIDSVPLIPKLMEIVGLSYTLWFTTRYLLFKKNREELAAKIEEIKQQVLGYDDD